METDNRPEIGELKPISLNETCVVGSIFYKDYKTPGSDGNVRGDQAIDSLIHIVEKGCKAVIVINKDTDTTFIQNLKDRLLKIDVRKAENLVWNYQKWPGYSQSRREAIKLARSKYPETRAFITQEIEKDLSSEYEKFVDELSNNKILVMMNRGVNVPYNKNPWLDANHLGANLPREQFWGERHQNIKMAKQENAAGLTKKEYAWDRLNGTRIIRNEVVRVGDVQINPTDLLLLKYEYVNYDESDRANKIDTYSSATYNFIPILEALGAENQISEVPVKYWHPDNQKKLEENNPDYRVKRLNHKNNLPAINFDIVANIKEWQKKGKWPQVLVEALGGDKLLKIRHFDESQYSLTS